VVGTDELTALGLWLLGLLLLAVGTILVRRYGSLVMASRSYALVGELARVACLAAEQLGEKHLWTGEEKKEFARTVIDVALERLGIQLAPEEIDAVIEATVYALKHLQGDGP
jgi:hypothetical protein